MASLREFIDSFEEKSLQSKLIILFVIIFLLCLIFWYFIWSPRSEELDIAGANLQREERKLQEYESVARDLPKFEKEFKRLNKEFEKAALKLPKEKEIPTLIDSVYAAVSASGLESITFTPKGEVRRDIYAEIPIEMKVLGSYFELANFFDRISVLPRIVNVNDLDLKRDENLSIDGNIVLDAQFTTVTFRVLPIDITKEASVGEGGKKGNL